MKKALPILAAALLIASPVAGQVQRETRPFLPFATEFVAKSESIQSLLGSNDYETAATELADLAVWIISGDPEPCYAVLWGISATFSAASAQSVLVMSYSDDPLLILAVSDLVSRLDEVQKTVTSGPPVDC